MVTQRSFGRYSWEIARKAAIDFFYPLFFISSWWSTKHAERRRHRARAKELQPWYLEQVNREKAKGTHWGQAHTARSSAHKGSGCFIATAAYGDQDFGRLDLLREYRDSVLYQTIPGRWFIWLYYRVAPWPARVVARSPRVRRIVRRGLDIMVSLIERTTALRRDPAQEKAQANRE